MPSTRLYLASAAHCVGVVCSGSDLPAVAKKGFLKCQRCVFSESPSPLPTPGVSGDWVHMGGTGYPPLFFAFLKHWDLLWGEEMALIATDIRSLL